MTEYDLYIQQFGNSHCSQVSTQTKDDTLDREVQCDDWWVEDKWVSATMDLFVDSGAQDPSLPWISKRKGVEKSSQEDKVVVTDGPKLNKFLQKAAGVRDLLSLIIGYGCFVGGKWRN